MEGNVKSLKVKEANHLLRYLLIAITINDGLDDIEIIDTNPDTDQDEDPSKDKLPSQIPHLDRGRHFCFVALIDALILDLMPLLQSLIPRACKQGIKSNVRAIKCCKERKITALPNECCNIPIQLFF